MCAGLLVEWPRGWQCIGGCLRGRQEARLVCICGYSSLRMKYVVFITHLYYIEQTIHILLILHTVYIQLLYTHISIHTIYILIQTFQILHRQHSFR